MSDDGQHHETLIIKRHGGGHHDEHHGGVWKIAFADFMTAMMAFFLVMWLISANDKTKATIAKYFNPIELVDSTPQPVGLNDVKKDDPNVERKSGAPAPAAPGKEAKPEKSAAAEAPEPKPVAATPIDEAEQSARHDETELMRDPYAVIAEIASKTSASPPKQSVASTGTQTAGGTGAVGLKNGEAFRDPFEPQPMPAGGAAGILPDTPPPPAAPPHPVIEGPAAKATPPAPPPPASASAPTAVAAPAPEARPSTAPPATPAQSTAPTPTPSPVADKAMAGAPPPTGTQAAGVEHGDDKPLPPAALRAKIADLVKPSADTAASPAPRLEVRRTEEGTLISLTDSADFAMFGNASARPSARMVALMETIGRLLRSQKGAITIRGFTDGRPFRSDTYDNWRLSTERAHIAQIMLLRGGLDDARIDRIEGYADRRPKNVKDRDAPENRRIEILLRDANP